ncbi:hypothetical protein ACVWZK_007753 [Bradyrhizobium sp. GM0.4]
MNVVVSMQDQLDAVAFQKRQQPGGVSHALVARAGLQGMMHQQHAKDVLGCEPLEHLFERRELFASERACRHQRQGGHRRGQADQCERPAPAQARKADTAIVARKIGREGFAEAMKGSADISVVIAGNRGDAVGRTDAVEPGARRRELRLQRQIDEIACDRDVVGTLRLHVGDKGVEHLAALVFVTVARPVDIAERALAGELDQPRLRQRRQMRVGQMGEREGSHGGRLPRYSSAVMARSQARCKRGIKGARWGNV